MTSDAAGGVWQYTAELSGALAAAGHDVLIACLAGPPSAAQRRELARGVELRHSTLPLEWMNGGSAAAEATADWIDDLVARHAPDLVHFNAYGPAARARPVPCLLTLHSCVHSWWRAVRGGDPDATWDGYRALVIRALTAAGRIVAPTGAVLEAIAACYPEAPLAPRARVIHNGVSAAAGADTGTRGAEFARSDEPDNDAECPPLPDTFVLAAGRLWDEAKNLALLERVADHLPAPVVIAGPASPPGRADDVAPPTSRNLARTGMLSRPALAACYPRAAVYAHPARYEPFGLVVLEAALAGRALVLADIPSLRELWEGNAVFLPPDDADAWTHALTRLLAHPAERHAWGERARCRAARYGAGRMARGYLGLYAELLAGGTTRRGAA